MSFAAKSDQLCTYLCGDLRNLRCVLIGETIIINVDMASKQVDQEHEEVCFSSVCTVVVRKY